MKPTPRRQAEAKIEVKQISGQINKTKARNGKHPEINAG